VRSDREDTRSERFDCPECRSPQPDALLRQPFFAYAIGTIEPRFATLGLERELEQVTGHSTGGTSLDREILHEALSRPENAYVARRMCWVLVNGGVDACSLNPAAEHLEEYVAASSPDAGRICAVVGDVSGEPCLSSVPAVEVAQLLSFTLEEFVAGVPPADGVDPERLAAAIGDVFRRIAGRDGNLGLTPEHRALNFIALRYPAVYHTVADGYAHAASLASIDTRHSHQQGRTIVDVRVTMRGRQNDFFRRYRVRVDTSDVFPFLVSPLEEIFDY
jgi:hypothetical protein